MASKGQAAVIPDLAGGALFLIYHYDTIYQSTTMKLILALVATNLATIPTAAIESGTTLHTSALAKNVTIGHEEPTRAALSAVRRPLSVR